MIRALRLLDLAAAIGATALTVCGLTYLATREAAPIVNVRWKEDVSLIQQAELMQRYALRNCQSAVGRTATCELLDTSRANLAGIVENPHIEDTHHIERSALVIAEDAERGPAMTWVAYRTALFRRPGAIESVVVGVVTLILCALAPRLWLISAPSLSKATLVVVDRSHHLSVRLSTLGSRLVEALAALLTLGRAWCANPMKLFWIVAVALLVAQFSAVVFELSRYASDSGRLRAFDEDAAVAVEVMQRTRWYNDNGWRFYGPLYYRLAHSLESLAPLSDSARSPHFYLLLTSLLSSYALILVLCLPIPMAWPMRLLSIAIVSGAFLRQGVWNEMLFRARLDWLLSLCAAGMAASFLLLRRAPHSKAFFHLSALSLALGMLTKFIFAFFIPSALLLLLTHRSLRSKWKEMAGLTAGYYFVVGFPQSLGLRRDLRYIQSLNAGYSQSADLDAVAEWLSLFASQLLWPLLALLVAWSVFSSGARTPASASRRSSPARLLETTAVALPFVLLMSRKLASAHHYYTMPFVAFVLGGASVALGAIRLPWANAPRVRTTAFVVITVAIMLAGWQVPRELGARLAQEAPCRIEADGLYRFLEERAQNGETVFMDPFVPRPSDPRYLPYWKGSYTNNWRSFAEASPWWFVTYLPHAAVYLGRSPEYLKLWTKDAASSQAFYQSFQGDGPVVSPDGKRLIVERAYPCGWRVWRVEP